MTNAHDGTMAAMVLDGPGNTLRGMRLPIPYPQDHQVLIRVSACGVCRTDLHIADGEIGAHKLPLVLGHEIVGRIVHLGRLAHALSIGDRVGVPWLGSTCGACSYCVNHKENLCDQARFTGYDLDGGYAEYVVADARYVFKVPSRYDDAHAAPLLCAGLIGYRAYAMIADAQCVGLYGFGAAAHIIAQVAKHEGKKIFAFTRPNDIQSQQFALSLGVSWSGGSDEESPVLLDAAIIFASDGALIPRALAATRKGATIVCAGIHMSDIPKFPYSLLWGERTLRSVANLTRADGEEFLRIANEFLIQTNVHTFPLSRANEAMAALRAGAIDGAAVLINN